MGSNPRYIIGVGSRLTSFQTACDVVGMTEIPFVSQVADGISGLMSFATGDYIGAGLSVAGLVPGLGQLAGAAKMARNAKRVSDIAEVSTKSAKNASNSADSAKFLELTKKEVDKSPKQPANPKQPAKKNAEVDAKSVKKESTKEKEDSRFIEREKPSDRKLDIMEGETNPHEGNDLNINDTFNGTPKDLQTLNYNQFIKSIENGRPYYNPMSVMPKGGNMKI